MRWKKKGYKPPKDSEIRNDKVFAWLPITIDGETRWLEYVSIRRQYFSRPDCGCFYINLEFAE